MINSPLDVLAAVNAALERVRAAHPNAEGAHLRANGSERTPSLPHPSQKCGGSDDPRRVWAEVVAKTRATTEMFRAAVAEAEAAGCPHCIDVLRRCLTALEASELPETPEAPW